MKKSLANLLRYLEESRLQEEDANITSLNNVLSKSLKKGGYDSTNLSCGGNNNSCYNVVCPHSENNVCRNDSCLM